MPAFLKSFPSRPGRYFGTNLFSDSFYLRLSRHGVKIWVSQDIWQVSRPFSTFSIPKSLIIKKYHPKITSPGWDQRWKGLSKQWQWKCVSQMHLLNWHTQNTSPIYFQKKVFLTLGMLLKLWLKRADFVTDLTNKFLIGMFSKEMRPHFLLFDYFLTVTTWWWFLWMNIVMFSKADSIRKGQFTAFKRTRWL